MSERKKEALKQEFMSAYEAYFKAIHKHCYFRLFNKERANDLAQETFLRAWEKIASGEKIDAMRPFLYRVATNLIIDETRKKIPASLDKLNEDGFDVGYKPTTDTAVDAKILMKNLQKLDAIHQEILVLRFVNDLSIGEIGKILKISATAVYVRIHRAIKAAEALL